MSKTKLNVVLLDTPSSKDLEIIYRACRQCYYDGFCGDVKILNELAVMNLIDKIISTPHTSVIEHSKFTFAIEGVSRACYDDKTEVLTTRGWKLFKDLKPYDRIISKNTAVNDTVHETSFYNFTSYKYKGKMHHYTSDCIDLMVTPNHSMLIKPYDRRIESKYEFCKSEDISINRFYIDKQFHDYKVSKSSNNNETVIITGYTYTKRSNNGNKIKYDLEHLELEIEPLTAFLAWYLSDGCVYYDKKEQKYVITIVQHDLPENTNTRKEICMWIEKLGFHPVLDKNGIRFNNRQFGRFLSTLGKSYHKSFPFKVVYWFDEYLAKLFIDTYSKADGHVDKNNQTKLYSTSKVLIDQLQIIGCIAGIVGNISMDERNIGIPIIHKNVHNPIIKNHPCYVLSFGKGYRNQETVIKKKDHFQEVNYDGYVYCIEVPTHVLYVRRNGKTAWCGNCTHQLVRHRIASYSQQSQRYCGLDPNSEFNYIIPKSIEINDKAREMFINIMSTLNSRYHDIIDEVAGDDIDKRNKMAEDARFILPNATETKIVVTMNYRGLDNFFKLRCCQRAQWEIRAMANEMLRLCNEAHPELFKRMGAPCTTTGVCPESKKFSCGKYPTLEEIKHKAQLYDELTNP